MQRADIEANVVAVLSAILRQPVDAGATRATVAQWDSLKHIEIVFALEEELGIQFSETELTELDSVLRIVDAALAHHAA
jgi:acyl carrier protein